MKKLIFLAAMIIGVLPVSAQTNKINQPESAATTATLKSASRLFAAKDDLTSVILVIPSGSTVNVLGSDSTYLHITFEENDGYILKRQAVIDKKPVTITSQQVNAQKQVQETPQAQPEEVSRFSYLEDKYGTNMVAKLNSGKIWKGMNAEMVKDSWGAADKINRVISGNIIQEEWTFKNTWLYFENNTLKDWGPTRK